MPDMWMDVDTALSEVPVNLMPLIDDTDFKTVEDAIAYNASGMDLRWNFVTTGGAYTSTAVTPTTSGTYDWTHQGDGMYSIEIPASGGASINNDTEGFGWFSGKITGVLPFRGPIIGFRAAALNDALIDGGDTLDVNLTELGGSSVAATTLKNQALAAATGTVASDAGNSSSSFKIDTTLGAKASDYFGDSNGGLVLVFVAGAANEFQARRVTGFNGTTDFITVESAFAGTPTTSDAFILLGRIEA